MKALHRKLLREIWQLKGQGMAIAVMVAAGVAMYVMSFTTLEALRHSQRSVYEEQEFADVFVALKRAPEAVVERLRAIDGVALADTRVIAPLNMPMAAADKPVTGLAISIPDGEQPVLNRLYLKSGQLPLAGSQNEVVVSEAFAEVWQLEPGDRLPVVINGRYQELLVSGTAISPEYIYQIRPGDLFPDFSRYAILWLNRPALEAAFDMQGAFNHVVLRLAAGASEAAVINAADVLLEPWGALGAHGRDEQLSHRYLDQELAQLESMAYLLPLLFIGVAAFLLNVVAARLISTQREQVAVLKAFGYSGGSVALHYLLLMAGMVLAGALLGIVAGTWLASVIAGIYQDYFRFPWLDFTLRPAVALAATAIAGAATLVGTLGAVTRAYRLHPAEAMRPPAPARFRTSLLERAGLTWLSQPSRIIWRNLERQAVKSLLSVLGIALAVAMVMLTAFQGAAIDHMMDVQFRLAQRQDLTLSLNEAEARRALFELAALPGVSRVEGFRAVPAVLRLGHREYRGSVQGMEPGQDLARVLDADLRPITLPPDGLLLTDHLADMLSAQPGDTLEVQVLDGERPLLRIPVAGLVTEYIGVGAYMQLAALARHLGEDERINGAHLAIDMQQREALDARLAAMPAIAGTTFREDVITAFEDMMDETLLVFTLFSMLLAGSIAFAVVYNNARITWAERNRELASLRVLGFHQHEVAWILLGELLVLTLLAILPGFLIGQAFGRILTEGMKTDLFRVPLVLDAGTYGMAVLVVMVASLLSALILLRALVKLDMVTALKR